MPLSVQGWAGIRGWSDHKIQRRVRFALPGRFSVGDLPGVPTTGTRRFGAWIFSDEGATAKVQEFTVPKGPQHIVMIVEAAGTKPSVTLALMKDSPPAAAQGFSIATAQLALPQFIFYSAEITRLK